MNDVIINNLDTRVLSKEEFEIHWPKVFLEFKEEGYKRFECETMPKWWVNFKSNDELLELSILPKIKIRFKSLPELNQHDVEYYGSVELAYQMWQWRYVDKTKWITEDGWSNCNKRLSFNPDKEYRRKESAELEFNLERALKGDVVEWLDNNIWHIVEDLKLYSIDNRFDFNFRVPDYKHYLFRATIKSNRLRMRFPERVVNHD